MQANELCKKAVFTAQERAIVEKISVK